jgi:DnaJ domain
VPADPYRVLGVPRDASNEELHDAYRRLVKLHHPDRNGGSAESSRRFQEIQAAYEAVRDRHGTAPAADESVEERMATLERELREALGERLSHTREHPAVRRVSDLIDGLEDLASRLDDR